MNTFFCSDMHFLHANIIRYCNRPFLTHCSNHIETDWDCRDCKIEISNLQTRGLIKRWNEVVGQNDLIYNLGDFIWTKDPLEWASIVYHLNGRQRIIVGNHDSLITDKNGCAKPIAELPDEIQGLVRSGKIEWIKNYFETKIHGKYLVMFHFPLTQWHRSMYGSWAIHGHSHSTNQTSWPRSIQHGKTADVGVDCHNYAPVSFDQLKDIMDSCTNELKKEFENA